ncbi:hypothetical protein [Streptomyces sp. NPDC001292]|uniref:hypothetical protein n=1 Tax=Streptomyces sp. NPDC001292 TaxID=3364558 RepID=UPI0036AC79B8
MSRAMIPALSRLDFPGWVVVTAHDRWFLDRVATHVLTWEGAAPLRAPDRPLVVRYDLTVSHDS